MKHQTAILVVFFIFLFSSSSFSQISTDSQNSNYKFKDKFIKYISVEMGYGGTESNISNIDTYLNNNFYLKSGNRYYAGASVKIPYVTAGLFYYKKSISAIHAEMTNIGRPHISRTDDISTSYLSIVALYDLLELNVSKTFFINFKVGGNASILLSEIPSGGTFAPSNFDNKSIVWGLNGKLENTLNIQDVDIMLGIDYTHDLSNTMTYKATSSNHYDIKTSTFRFYGGIRKYF